MIYIGLAVVIGVGVSYFAYRLGYQKGKQKGNEEGYEKGYVKSREEEETKILRGIADILNYTGEVKKIG